MEYEERFDTCKMKRGFAANQATQNGNAKNLNNFIGLQVRKNPKFCFIGPLISKSALSMMDEVW